jgi:hypothetical protein
VKGLAEGVAAELLEVIDIPVVCHSAYCFRRLNLADGDP